MNEAMKTSDGLPQDNNLLHQIDWSDYTWRLIRLAATQGKGLEPCTSPSSIVQSVFRNFFRRLKHGKPFPPEDRLWPYLAQLTVWKIQDRRKKDRRQKRRLPGDPVDCYDMPPPDSLQPTPAQAAELNELIARALELLQERIRKAVDDKKPSHQKDLLILNLHLRGLGSAAIAQYPGVELTQAGVINRIRRIEAYLRERLAREDTAEGSRP